MIKRQLYLIGTELFSIEAPPAGLITTSSLVRARGLRTRRRHDVT